MLRPLVLDNDDVIEKKEKKAKAASGAPLIGR